MLLIYLIFSLFHLEIVKFFYNFIKGNMKKYENINMLAELQLGDLNFSDLAKKYKVSRVTVRSYAKRSGLHKGNLKRLKTYTLDVNYFNLIDNPNKAYVLGFIYADGCNTRRGLQIGIQEEDKEVLEFIKKELNSNNNLRYVKPFKEGWLPKWELIISSKELSESLTKAGCPPSKSLILDFPNLSDNLIPHFIRGYFDGDGGLSICKKGYGRLSFISGSKVFIDKLRNYFLKKTGDLLPLYEGKAYSLQTSKQSLVKNIINLMYTDSTFSMQRKYKKACELMVETGGSYFISIT